MNKLIALLSASFLIVGCGDRQSSFSFGSPKVGCGSPDGVSVIKKLLGDAAQNQAMKEADGRAASVRAAAANFQIELSEFRTEKQDPSSSKVFCAATLNYRLDPSLLVDLNASAAATTIGSLDRLASAHGFELHANVFVQQNFKYSLQPTDDGSMVFGESSDGQSSSMLSDLILMDVIRESSAPQNKVDMSSELARIEAERAKITAAAAQLAEAQQLAAQTYAAPPPTIPAQQYIEPQDQQTFSPAFDCRQATLPVEQLVCSDPVVSFMDVRLSALYRQAIASGNASAITAYQAQWLQNRRNLCQSVECLLIAYADQIKAFSTTQPDLHPILSALSSIEIPNSWDPGVSHVNSPRDGFLSLRSHPSTSEGRRLVKIAHGEPLSVFYCLGSTKTTIDGVTGTWCVVNYDDTYGFAFDPYLGE